IGVLQSFHTSRAGFAHSQRGQAVMDKVEHLPKPVIAAINGYALGGGLELAMACDVRLASENARMGQPETTIGVSMGYGGSQRLPRLVGKGMAKLLVLTGGMIDAQEALRIGLVQKVVPQAELLSEAKALATKMAANAPLSLAAAKEAVNMGLEVDLRSGLYVESLKFGSLCPTEDYQEGTTAFLEKRKPAYKGR
ncbi:MAG: enoyl-CoA hydratase-related protein, partial [Anaerolineae bacterium]|nr:enoyl-CoA hydratase-related protein [Anaerolineae bacterium]